MQIVREFSKRNEGKIGQIVLESDVSTIKLNGKPIPIGSIEYLMNFALQSFQDSYAGKENTLEDCKALFEKKLDAVQNGTLGMRTGGGNSAVSDEIRIARQIVRAKFKMQAAKSDWKAFLESDETEQTKFLDEKIEKNAKAVSILVADEMKRIAEKKAAMNGISFEL